MEGDGVLVASLVEDYELLGDTQTAPLPEEKVKNFGMDTPLGRAGQPAELAPVYVLLASDEGGYISAARIAVTGGRPIL